MERVGVFKDFDIWSTKDIDGKFIYGFSKQGSETNIGPEICVFSTMESVKKAIKREGNKEN